MNNCLVCETVRVCRNLNRLEFAKWLGGIKDDATRARLTNEVRKLGRGLRSDWKPVGEGVKELRITYGSGYRIYFTDENGEIVLLLTGGGKSSKKKQSADIMRAQVLKEEYRGKDN